MYYVQETPFKTIQTYEFEGRIYAVLYTHAQILRLGVFKYREATEHEVYWGIPYNVAEEDQRSFSDPERFKSWAY